MRTLGIAVFFLLAITTAAFADGPPLPADMTIAAPAGVPADMARFSGKWSGDKWDGKLDTILVVEQISPSGEAKVIYAWGDYAPWQVARGWARYDAKIGNSELRFGIPSQNDSSKTYANVTYMLNGDGTLAGTFVILRSGNTSKVLLHRE